MSKKKCVAIVLVCLGVILLITASLFGFKYFKDTTKKYDQALKKATEARKETGKSRKDAEAKLKATREKLSEANDKLADVSKELKKLKVEYVRSKIVEVTSTPEATPVPTETIGVTQPGNEFSDGKCYMDIYGNFEEIGSGRVQISVTPHDAGAPDDYLVNIQGSNGAADSSLWQLTANWDAGSSSLIYQGIRTDNVNGVTTTYDGISGTLRFDGPDTLYWTDPSTENYDRGPFTKY